jgi:hypothetical protein
MRNGNLDTAYVSNGSVVDVHGNFDNQTNTAYLQIRSIKDITTQEVVMEKDIGKGAEYYIVLAVVMSVGLGTFYLIYLKQKQQNR